MNKPIKGGELHENQRLRTRGAIIRSIRKGYDFTLARYVVMVMSKQRYASGTGLVAFNSLEGAMFHMENFNELDYRPICIISKTEAYFKDEIENQKLMEHLTKQDN